MEHWVKTTKSRIASIISKIKRQKLQNSRIGRLIKVSIKKLIILAVVLYKFAVTKISFIDKKYWNPARTKLVHRYTILQKWDKWRYRPQARAGAMFLVAVIVVSNIFSVGLFAAPDINETWDLSNPTDYAHDSGIEMISGTARLKAQNYTSDANTSALYHFDESGGLSATDSSANNNNAIITGGSFTTGNLNNAINLNGTSDKIITPDSASLRLGQQQTIEGWTKFNTNFNSTSHDTSNSLVDKGDYKVYYNNETGKLTYELANNNANSWDPVGPGWQVGSNRSVSSSTSIGTTVYAGLGNGTGDAEVWRWNGTTWTKIGGDGLNGSWADQIFEEVVSLTTDGTNIFAGLGNGTGDGEVWRWNGTTWTKIGGDSINSSWGASTYETINSLTYSNSFLYAGLGNSANDAEVWRWNGTTWTKIGGDSINSGWAANFEIVNSLAGTGTTLYAGLGNSTTDAEVWRWNGTTWTKIGGDGLNSSWNTTFETVRSLYYQGTTLYAGVGDGTTDAEVWSWNGTTWTKIGGDGLNSSWNTNYEYVNSIVHDGTNLYAGLGNGDGDGEVWRYNGTTWTQIGGDGLNSSWATALGDSAMTMTIAGSNIYAGLYDAAGGGYLYSWNGTSWTAIGGQNINNSWGYFGHSAVEVTQVSGDYLYAGLGITAGSAEVWRMAENGSWNMVGGQGFNGSWSANTYEYVSSMTSHQGHLIVGLGSTASDAEVWEYNGTTWTKIGGDSINSGWVAGYEEVNSLASYGGQLYAGLGNSSSDAEVWRWNGSSWTKIGGDSINSGWVANYERVSAMTVFNGELYVGLGVTAGDAELWRWNGTAWAKVAGDSLNSSWNNTIEQVESLVAYNNKLYVGLGNSASDAEVWEYNGTTWTKIGGDTINSSWLSGTYERVRSMTVYNGFLFAGLGNGTGDGEAWKYDGNNWVKVGGASQNGSWNNAVEEVRSLTTFRGKLYAGTGSTANVDANLWAMGDNGFLQSNTNSFNTDWRHVAVTYDGITMKMFINGILDSSVDKAISVTTSTKQLLIGNGYDGRDSGKPQSRFQGRLDEVRLSNIARSSFTTKPYLNSAQTIQLANSVYNNGIWHWDTLSDTTTLNGGSINYRLSADGGTTWLYWNGSAWVTSSNTSESNTTTDITNNFDTFPVTFSGLKWQAVLLGDGNQQVTLDGVSAQATSDNLDPSSNPSAINALKANGGSALSENDWTNGSSPYFTWTGGSDGQSGIKGYCVYLGTDGSADPTTTKGLLGSSPIETGGNCQFIISGNSLDLGTPGYVATPLTTSNSNYYLNIRSIDIAGNVSPSSEQFSFRFDNTPPSNPGFITAPSGFVNTKDINMTWNTSGGSAPSDSNSGLSGLQYRIGDSGVWYGDNHTGLGNSSDILANDGSYTTHNPIDYNNLIEGINTVYFRTWDQAGNVTTNYTTATLKINTNGAPSEPVNLVPIPGTNTVNSFGFNWDSPSTYIGNVNQITYCYTVNVLPSLATCSYTAPGSTELTIGAYATQPGTNTIYVVARDESNNINYSNYASTNFIANTTSPGIPLNTDLVDVSVKATSNWRLAITWTEPTSVGSGVANYRIFRSTNGVNFSQIGSSSSTTYIDAGLTQQNYYYRVSACDNTNNCGAVGTVVSGYPTGKFTSPATIVSQPTVSGVTTKKAKISWSTDRNSDSKIAIGTKSGTYSTSEIGNSSQVSAHEIALDNLSPGTTYYFVTKWTDEDGNTGTSSEKTFITAPAPSVKEATVNNITLGSATVEFTTKGAKKANVYYGPNESFGGLATVNTSSDESRYQVDLDNLSDGTKYYYMVSTFDDEGAEYLGNVLSFTTPPRPRISNLRFQPVTGEPTSTQKISWDTNVASTSQVIYGVQNGPTAEVQNSTMSTSHEVVIKNLKDNSQYTLRAFSRDSAGNVATSDQQSFKTSLDTRPPKVSDIVVETAIRGTGSEARGQIVVTWRTDELSTSQVAYAEGSGATVFNSRTAEDTRLTTEHLVIISDLPTSQVFSIKPVSQDSASNEGEGNSETAIIGRASDNVLTIVFNTLKSIFGF